MSTLQQLLADKRFGKYTSIFTTAEIISYMNITQRQIFTKVPHEAIPFYFPTVASQALYPLPPDCKPKGIRKVDIETATSGKYEELSYKALDDPVSDTEPFYSLIQQTMCLNPIPDSTTAGRKVYIYYHKTPTELSESNLTATPDLETEYQELLILGALKRICEARKDVAMVNNYSASYDDLFVEYKREYYDNTPPRVRQIKNVYGW